jgi:plastocyanin/PKD repeat protein
MKTLWTLISVLFLIGRADGQACEALFTFDATNLTIHFQDQSTHAPNNPITSWSWDFDDGGTSTQQNPTHTFPDPDHYDVNLTIHTQNGCTSIVEIRIEICDFGINYTLGPCNSSGQIPVSFSITDIFDNANEIDVILDDQSVPGSPFEIDADNPVNITIMVPGNGLLHVIHIQSTDIETCGRTVQFTTDDCSSDCFLSSLNVAFSGGTTHNVTVGNNFFSPQSIAIELGDVVHFSWQGSGHSTTSDATSGPDSWNSGVIGGGSTFDVNIHNPGTHNYYCQPHGGPGGVGMSGQILSNCPSGSTIPISVSFNTTIANAAGYNVLWDNAPVAGSPFNYNGVGNQSVTINISGDGSAHELIVRDVADPSCDLQMTYNAPDCGQGGGTPVCSISGTVGNFSGCNNNNITATLTVNVTNGGSGFNVSIDNGPNVFHTYTGNTTTVTITLPGDGNNHTVEITDNADATCTATINTVTPDCSVPCNITNLTATASSGNGGPSGIVHTVNVQDFQFNPNVINITTGDLVQWVWTGAVAHTSTSDATSGPDSWNSGLLNNGATYISPLLTEGTHPYYCVPHGAPGGVGMSGTIFVLPPCNANGETNIQVAFDIVSNGTQGFQVLVDGTVGGTFPYVGGTAQSASVLVQGDAMSHVILVRDVANPSCSASTSVTTPDCGGGGNPVCNISLTATVGNCTGANVPVTLDVNATNNAATFTVTIDGQNAGTYNYNLPTVTITIPGDGQSHNIVVTDTNDPSCTASDQVIAPDCSLPCSISGLSVSVASGNGGPSGIIHNVSVEDFQFNPNVINITVGDVVKWNWAGAIPHTSTSDISGTPNSWNSGLLNNGATYTGPVLDEGDHGYYCIPHGSPGGVGMSGMIHVLPACNEFGQTSVQINFNSTNGGNAGYSVIVDGNNAGNFSYAPGNAQSQNVLIAGNGQSHTVVVQDISDASCNASATVITPNCSGEGGPCSISFNPSVTGGCNNGSVSVALHVTGSNHSATYTVTIDGQAAGSYNYSNQSAAVNINGDGQPHVIVITDGADPACTSTETITTTDCSQPCSIVISDLSFGTHISHTVNVQDFQFSPAAITINLGDTLRFVWTGVIPHTVTSDAPTGPNAFNSGLLSQGASWQLIPNATGSFPYYCIPHGAPGGVGMSGVINVTSSCEGNIANGTLQIQYNGTSGQGFNVTEDGNTIAGSPFPFAPSGQLTIPLSVNGDGGQHTFSVSDVGVPPCVSQQSITVPSCNQTCTLNITQAVVSGCIGNTVSLTVQFTSNQPTAAYNVYKDDLKLNPSPLTTDAGGNGNYSTFIVGNNTTATIRVQFIENGTCSATQSVIIPSCAAPCLISDFQVGHHGTSHTVEVKDFAFSPSSLDILIGDTVHFVWTGVIPHTTTSDQFMGPHSWNSGLLGQGATYDLVITDTGNFPYYCQPHGGPGGIGMSGVIHVLDTCSQESWLTNMTFNVSAGSPLGYNVFVDGVKITDTPLYYDDPVGTNDEIIHLPGDGAWHLVTIQDLETGFCAYTIPVLTSICGAGCSVVNLTANVGVNIIHTVEVRDFDYFPKSITVGAGELIHFVWTGDIPHTVTSDALTGPEVWNSGLLVNGATYDLIINTPGVHPFFCIPHGGPNGIGMSGVITVLPACADNKQNVQAKFNVTQGSLQGYNLFVDGQLYGNNPRPYDDRKGSNEVMIQYPADSHPHILTIQDLDNDICAASEFFTMGSCDTTTCALNGLDYYLGNGRKYEVLVRDFDYEPSNLQVELGDTIEFKWIGSIPHTVTSDASTGEDVFNSGLLGQGSSYDLVLTTTGTHPYYCIPHGAPGGIGMAGNINVVDPCIDGKVFVDFVFFADGPGSSYDVSDKNNIVIQSRPYQQGGVQSFALELDAQGQTHDILVSDNGPGECTASIAIDTLDCSDPCFLTFARFEYDINYSTLEVQFFTKARGNISSWHWDFGDGTSSNEVNPVHKYNEAILYEVCLTIADNNGCTDVYCDKIRLGADVCSASFNYLQNGLDFIFYNTSDVSQQVIAATWTFGDGASSVQSDSSSHTFVLGLYEVCITVTSTGCVDTYCQILDLTDPCLALKADYQIINEGNPLQYQFTDMSSGPVSSHLWGFGDGQISTVQNPSHSYSQTGVYTVCLLILDPDGHCTDSDCRTLFVGTTGIEPDEVKMRKLMLAPNPSSSINPIARLSGFDPADIGGDATLVLYGMNGEIVQKEKMIPNESNQVHLPPVPGIYYLQILTGKHQYGAMVVVQ